MSIGLVVRPLKSSSRNMVSRRRWSGSRTSTCRMESCFLFLRSRLDYSVFLFLPLLNKNRMFKIVLCFCFSALFFFNQKFSSLEQLIILFNNPSANTLIILHNELTQVAHHKCTNDKVQKLADPAETVNNLGIVRLKG